MADLDLQIRGVSGHPDPEIRWGGGGRFPKNFFLTLPQFSLNIRGGAGPQDPHLDPPLQQYKKQRHTTFRLKQNMLVLFVHAGRKSSICKTTSGLKNPCKLRQMGHHDYL